MVCNRVRRGFVLRGHDVGHCGSEQGRLPCLSDARAIRRPGPAIEQGISGTLRKRRSAQESQSGPALAERKVLTAPTFKAVLNDKGELVKDANGRLIRGPLDRIVVMEKRTGWGAEYAPDLRNGDWEYARFRPDGTLGANVNYNACFQCHKPKGDQDFVFT